MESKTVFRGVINGKVFDNFDEFNKYLKENMNNISSIQYDYSVEGNGEKVEEPEEIKETEQAALPNIPEIYPTEIDPDQYLAEHEDPWGDLDDVRDMYDEYVEKHRLALREMDVETLLAHIGNLRNLRNQCKKQMKQNQSVRDKVSDDLEYYKAELAKTNEEIDRLHNYRLKLDSMIGEKDQKEQILSIVDKLFGYRYQALKQALCEADGQWCIQYKGPDEKKVKEEKVKEEYKKDKFESHPYYKPLKKLIEEIMSL